MCSVAPFVLPGFAPLDAPPFFDRRRTMAAAYVEPPPAPCGYDDDDDIEGLLRDIDAVVHPPTPAGGLTPQTVADGGGADLLMSSAEFLALSRQDADADAGLEAFLRGTRTVHVPATGGLAPAAAMMADEATPTTPVAVLGAPLSYADDAAANTIKVPYSKKQQEAPSETYDADIDAALRAMEKDPAERPSPVYLWETQDGAITMADRAELVASMHDFVGFYKLAPGTLHRAVSYVDRFLSAMKIGGGGARHQLGVIAAAAVFAAAKYEDRSTTRWALDADVVAGHAGSTRREVAAAELELVAALGYRLGGPTAYTFVDHFTRHCGGGGQEEEEAGAAAVWALAHHLADLALLDYRCLRFPPSVVAAAAALLARMATGGAASWSEEMKETGCKLEDVIGCVDAIYDMHEHQYVWPGCAQIIAYYELSYCLPSRSTLIDVH